MRKAINHLKNPTRDGRDHRAHWAIPHAVWRPHVSYTGRVDPLSAVEWQAAATSSIDSPLLPAIR